MTVVVCTDTRGGMLFLGRRVSRDREILADLATLGGRLICHPFSEKYLASAPCPVTVLADPFSEGEEGDVLFVENLPLRPHLDRIEKIIRYSFEERYPFDTALDVDPIAEGFRLAACCELVGHSHPTMKKEVYVK
ncbi:MAG: hypothetical protein J6T24_03175 [Clostridia bacterium]|nr:hypothetical protein [Clostridia bacterium]